MKARTRGFLLAYRLALIATPREFRRLHALEMSALVADRLEDALEQRGVWRWWVQALYEMVDVVRTGLSLRLTGVRHVVVGLPIKNALRGIRRRPGFAALTTGILSLGLGIAITIGSVIDTVLLRPLPYVDGSRLVMIWRTFARPGMVRGPASYPDYVDLRASSKTFADIATFGGMSLTFEEGPAEQISGLRVSGNLLTLLGNAPALGRAILPVDDDVRAEPTIVLSHALWFRRFGADSSIIGRILRFGERRYRVVGVMPERFAFPNPGPQFWTALRLDASRVERDANRFQVIGRLSPNSSLADAQREIEQIAARIKAEYPGINPDAGIHLEARHDAVVAPVRSMLLLLGLAGFVVLSMTVVNVTNLLLVRSVARRHELGIRRALGASRGAIVRDYVAEGVLLAGLSCAIATGVAAGLSRVLLAVGAPIPRAAEIGVSPRVVGLGLLVALLTLALPALLVLLDVGRDRHALAMGHRQTASRGAQRAYAGFVALQIALALTMFVTAGVLARSFYNLVNVSRGFDGSRILTAYVSLPAARYASDESRLAFFNTLVPRLGALPGVERASATWALPFSDGYASSSVIAADQPTPKEPPAISMAPVLPDFFRTLGVPLRSGRDFASTDDRASQPVAIVNETLARQFWPGRAAVGQRIRPADSRDGGPITVVGVVADIKRRALNRPVEPEVYRPYAQALYSGDLYVTLRVSGDPLAIAPGLKGIVNELDPRLPVMLVATLDALVDASIVGPRFRATMIGVFALLAGGMALVGVYGVLGFVVATRRREIAIRGALGATSTRAAAEVIAHGVFITGVGIVAGLAGAAGVGSLLRTMVFGIGPYDLSTYVVAVFALWLVAALGSWLPARRATRVDPILVLHEESAL